jgi:CheY-like chemotaxis protein
MTGNALRVLHVEDDFADAMLVQHAVCEAGDFDIAIEVVGTLKDAKRKLSHDHFDLVLLDLRLPDSLHPIDTLETTQACCGDTPLLVLSGSMRTDDDHLPEDVTRLDKNVSFKSRPGEAAIDLALIMRQTAESDDFMSI